MALYDAFNPAARDYYWNLVNNSLFKIGVDAW
jgi:alpha-glucosidase (family GH31 glycosyl hydrolase)